MKIIDKVIEENCELISNIGMLGCPGWYGYKEECMYDGLSKTCEECWNREAEG